MNSKQLSHYRFRFLLLMQFSLILAPFALFFDAAVNFRGRMNLSVPAAAAILIVLNGGCLLLAALSVLRYIAYRKQVTLTRPADHMTRKERLLSYLPATLVASVFSVLAGFQFDTIPRYDGGMYYDSLMTATETFTFTLDSYLQSFALWTHPMQGTTLLIGAGEMLFPRQCIGVYIVTLFVTIGAIFCMYGIMGRIFPEKSPWLKAAGTAVFAFCPYVLGLFSHLSADYFSLMFLVILIYTFSVELDYLAAFMTILLVFSKETGILFAASFLIPAILIRAAALEGKHYFAKLMKYLVPGRLLLYGTAPILFVVYSLFSVGLTFGSVNTDKSPFRWDGSSYHCFGFNLDYISGRVEQILYLNFFWIATLLFFIAILVYLFRARKIPQTAFFDKLCDISLVVGILLSMLVYTIFSCLFITIMCPRYNVYFALPISLVVVSTITYIWKRRVFVKIMLGIILLLFLLQNYFTLDPSFLFRHEKIDLGYQYINTPTKYKNQPYVCELYAYNQTYSYAEDLLDQVMETIEPENTDHFLAIDEEWRELNLYGDTLFTAHLIYWDPIHQKRTYDYLAPGAFVPQTYSESRPDILSDKILDLADDFYFILTAREDETALCAALENRGYSVTDSFEVSSYIGYLNVYHFSRK